MPDREVGVGASGPRKAASVSGWTEMRKLDHGVCDTIRDALAEHHPAYDEHLSESGIFGPIELVTRDNGRARCRECGEKIPAGEKAIAFWLDWYIRRFGRWGHAVRAYIHPRCPDGKEQ